MKAIAIFPEARETRLVDHPEPGACNPHQVKLEIIEVGVCGTDREICNFEYGAAPHDDSYLIPGHEAMGRVIEVGPQVERLKIGDLVIPTIRRPCPASECVACRSGYQDFCISNQYVERGIQKAHGFLTEQIIEDENNLIVVPASLQDVAVLVEPLTVTEKALRQIEIIQRRLPWLEESEDFTSSSVQPRQRRALVFGAGPVGLLAAMALQFRGFETFVYSREPAHHLKAKIMRQIGATYLSTNDVPIDLLARYLGSIDLIYEAAGSAQPTFQLMPVLSPNGICVLTGIPGHEREATIDTSRLMRDMVLKNQLILGTVNATTEDFQRAALDLQSFAHQWPDSVKQLISGRYSMREYENLALGNNSSIKNVLAIAD